MANVVEVVFERAERVAEVRAVGIIHLGPAGDPGFHEMAKVVAGNFALVAGNELVPFRAGSDEAHIAEKNVPELRNFVDSGGAEKTADASDPCVAHLSILIASGLVAHGAQLEQD